MELVLIILYGLLMTFILMYSFAQINLVIVYLRNRKKRSAETEMIKSIKGEYPIVTVQLPVYNEYYVVERLLDCIAEFDYPKDKLEIQVLDDSTDDSKELAAAEIKELQKRGIDIKQIIRSDRSGFKAGALAFGLKIAKGEFLAIFDADFLPPKDFLLKTIPHFQDDGIGVVQTRWGHINRNYSILTQMQALALDAHFRIEQSGRNAGGHFINFNGTAGVWRKTCIVNAGGWQSDTLTEDLDLSYRAQIAGWRFKYLENVESPAELPVQMNAVKTQQFRWTKGAAECARKNLPQLFRAKGISLGTKIHGFFHLMNSFIFICVLLLSIISVPLMYIWEYFPEYSTLFKFAGIYSLSMIFVFSMYMVASYYSGMKIFTFLYRFPLFLTIIMGLSLHNAIAVFEGYLGVKSPFVRTPKFNILTTKKTWRGNKYLGHKVSGVVFVEALLSLYFISAMAIAIYMHIYNTLPFFAMLAFGFGYVSTVSINHAYRA